MNAERSAVRGDKKKRILIVDDEMDMRIFMSTLFATSGYDPVAVRDGQQGLQQARRLQPDLVLLDVMMPGEGGAHMYQTLKSDPKLCEIPVIILSAVDRDAFMHYLKMLNARAGDGIPLPEAYIEKPPDAKEVLAVAEEILAKAH
jgi:two-component system phosphate regulon response regulator PhoB